MQNANLIQCSDANSADSLLASAKSGSDIFTHAKTYSGQQYLGVKKLKGVGIIRLAAKHNLREIQGELGAASHIDFSRTCLNRIIAGSGTAIEIATYAEQLLKDADVGGLRKDAVRGIEIVISLPAVSTIDHSEFFSRSLEWVRWFFGVPVLSAVIHLDESAPHCHFLLLPLVDRRMVGSDLVGNRRRLQIIQSNFFQQVGQEFGLRRPAARRRLSAAMKRRAASRVLRAVQKDPELLEEPDVRGAMLQVLARDPEPLLAALNLPMPTSRAHGKSFVVIMTKPCELEKTVGARYQAVRQSTNPILCRVRHYAEIQSASDVDLRMCGHGARVEPMKPLHHDSDQSASGASGTSKTGRST